MKSTYQSRNHTDSRDRNSQPVGGSREINRSGFDIYSLVESQLGDVAGGARIRSRRIGYLDLAASLMKSPKITRVHSSVMTTAGAYRAPASDCSIFSQKHESKFGFDLFNITPINDGGREGVSDTQPRIGEEKIWPVHDPINAMAKNKCKENWCDCSGNLEINILEGCINHSCGEKVSSEAVSERTTTPKNLGVTTNSLKCLEGSSVHE